MRAAASTLLALFCPHFQPTQRYHRYRSLPLPVLQGRGTGWSVWDGAVAAAKHLEQLALAGSLPAFDPPSILELGSGTGLAGLAAAVATGLPAVLTDLPEVLPALRRNVEANAQVWQKNCAAPTTAGSCVGYSCTAAWCPWALLRAEFVRHQPAPVPGAGLPRLPFLLLRRRRQM